MLAKNVFVFAVESVVVGLGSARSGNLEHGAGVRLKVWLDAPRQVQLILEVPPKMS